MLGLLFNGGALEEQWGKLSRVTWGLGGLREFQAGQTVLWRKGAPCSHRKLKRGGPDNQSQLVGSSSWDPPCILRHCLCSYSSQHARKIDGCSENHSPLAFVGLTTTELPRSCHGPSFEPPRLFESSHHRFTVPHSSVPLAQGQACSQCRHPMAQGPNLSAGCQEAAQGWLDLWTLGPFSQVWICPEVLSAHSPLPYPVGIRTSPRLLTFPIQLTWANCLQTLSLPSLLLSMPTATWPTQASLVSSRNNHQDLLACPLASISSSSIRLTFYNQHRSLKQTSDWSIIQQ